MINNPSLIFTFSGIRGVAGKELNKEIVRKIAFTFGENFAFKDRSVIIGRDTRPSGLFLEEALISGLSAANFQTVYKAGVCPTPVLIFMKNYLKIEAAVIITGSHNPPEWNGLKLIKGNNYLNTHELKQLKDSINNKNISSLTNMEKSININEINPFEKYLKRLYEVLNTKKIKKKNNLRVVIDTGAGAGKKITPKLLQSLGCEVKNINSELYVNDVFPRGIEPISENLHDLIMEVWQGKYDVGFAHDSDADRLAIIGEDGMCYPEDVGLAIIMEYILQNQNHKNEEIFFITNLASSLMFEEIGEKYGAKVIRTPIGEIFLVNEIFKLRRESPPSTFIFGGEGSCGGVIYPPFNTTRDGIFAMAKIVEILALTEEKISKLVSKLPKYYSYREIIRINSKKTQLIIHELKKELISEGENVIQINQDLKFGVEKDYFVLVHPSNTEPIIRVISEARSKSLARVYCQTTAELINLVISNLFL